jgi:uncharacterized membrane protein
MSHDLEFERLAPEHPEMVDRWLTRGAIAAIVALQFSLINDFGYGPRRIAPVVELILLIPITALTLRAERLAWLARDKGQLESASSHRDVALVLGLTLLVIVSLANARSLLLLLEALLSGKTHNGRTLLLDALNIWATNVIVFSLWYWALDRGGSWIDRRDHQGPSEFIFPYMTLPSQIVGTDARPIYVDYLFLSFNTSTAFSPTDTMPLTARMKLLMMLESIVSLGTLALVAARAVNILA